MYCSVAEEGGRGAASGLWVGGRQHADSDVGRRLNRRDLGLNLDPKTQTH